MGMQTLTLKHETKIAGVKKHHPRASQIEARFDSNALGAGRSVLTVCMSMYAKAAAAIKGPSVQACVSMQSWKRGIFHMYI